MRQGEGTRENLAEEIGTQAKELILTQGVVDVFAALFGGHQLGLAEDAQMVGDLGLRQVEKGLQITDAVFTPGEVTDQLEPDLVGQGLELVKNTGNSQGRHPSSVGEES